MNNLENEEKNILTSNQMIGELLLGIVLYGLISYVAYAITYKFIINALGKDNNLILIGIIVIALQIPLLFITFSLANKQAFKKGTIYKNEVNKVIKNISFVIFIILLIEVLGIFANVSSSIDETVKNDFNLNYQEKFLSVIYDENDMSIYQTEKEKAIKEAKNKLYQYLFIVESGVIIIYSSAILLEKRYIYHKAL